MEEINEEIKVKMLSAVTEALKLKKQDKFADSEQILKTITRFAEKEKSKKTQLAMIAAASKTLSISERMHFISEKEVIRKVMPELSKILEKVD